jgi:hypothetical protein
LAIRGPLACWMNGVAAPGMSGLLSCPRLWARQGSNWTVQPMQLGNTFCVVDCVSYNCVLLSHMAGRQVSHPGKTSVSCKLCLSFNTIRGVEAPLKVQVWHAIG